MTEQFRREWQVRRLGVAATLLLSIMLTGCYTRQIEGIQRDLDLIDRKIHKTGASGTSAAVSPTEINQLKKELEMVRSQQLGLTSDLETLKTTTQDVGSFASESFPTPIDPAGGKEIETLRKQVADNQKQLSRFEKELQEMQTTFDEVRTSMLDVIELLREEYTEGAPSPSPASGSTNSVTPGSGMAPVSSVELESQSAGMVASSGAARTYQVKPGDSLASIAKAHNVTVEDLKRSNQLANPNMLVRDQTIYIP